MADQHALGLELCDITKQFGDFVANDAVSFDVRPGEIHCLLGENGAGKSTLMNVLYGLLQPDGGVIRVDGADQHFDNPRQAMAAGIGMVHQHFMLVEVFTVAENLILGRENGPILNLDQARRTVTELAERYNLPVDPDAVIEDLPVGIQQRVEILKALANDAKYLIFDEPTAVLTPQEIDELMQVMNKLRDDGKGIIFITHKLREVRAVADRITVLRRGKVVGSAESDTSEAELAELMVGRSVLLRIDKPPAAVGDMRLKIEDLTVANPMGSVVVDHLSFDVRGGEILCIAGVQGNGQSELAEALLGTAQVVDGSVTLDGVDITHARPRQTIAAGMGFVPEDRQHDGFVESFTVAENLILNRSRETAFTHGMSLDLDAIARNAEHAVDEYDIRTESIRKLAGQLSGGNAQKLVLARELSRELAVLVASQPTRGVDVGAIEFLHKRIIAERDTGAAVVIISTELEEVEALADRILVMYRGRSVGTAPPGTPREVLGLMMAGVSYEDALASASGHANREKGE